MALPEDSGESSADIRASLSAAFDAAEQPVSDAAAQVAVESAADAEPSPETVSAADVSREDHPTDPLRYADGTFKPKASEAAPDKAAPEKTESPSVDNQTKASEPATKPDDAPPAGWTADAKPEWSKLSPAVKAAVLKREQEIAEGGRQWSEQKRGYEQILSPLVQETSRFGITPQEGLNQLLAASQFLQRDPVNAIKTLARQYNVDLSTLTGSTAQAPEGQQPDIDAIVERRVNARLAPIEQRFTAEDQRQQQQTVDIVTQFAASSGHEHFNAVSDDLMAMIPQIKAVNPSWTPEKVLQEAYDRAVFANPTTRAAMLAKRDADAEAKRQSEAAERAKKARVAASSVTGSPSGSPAVQVPDDIRGVLEAAWSGSLQ